MASKGMVEEAMKSSLLTSLSYFFFFFFLVFSQHTELEKKKKKEKRKKKQEQKTHIDNNADEGDLRGFDAELKGLVVLGVEAVVVNHLGLLHDSVLVLTHHVDLNVGINNFTLGALVRLRQLLRRNHSNLELLRRGVGAVLCAHPSRLEHVARASIVGELAVVKLKGPVQGLVVEGDDLTAGVPLKAGVVVGRVHAGTTGVNAAQLLHVVPN